MLGLLFCLVLVFGDVHGIPSDRNICNQSACGESADCTPRGKEPICTCPRGYEGDPLIRCVSKKNKLYSFSVLCKPSDCGENADCTRNGYQMTCSCPSGYIGNPYERCFIDINFADSFADYEFDNCEPSPCGKNASCTTRGRHPECYCPKGYEGDPLIICYESFPSILCNPSACGVNAICTPGRHRPFCSCPEGSKGDPLKACIPTNSTGSLQPDLYGRNSCNPNPCGVNAECSSAGARPVCSCPIGYDGDPSKICTPKFGFGSLQTNFNKSDPCIPMPCGVNAQCKSSGGQRHVCLCKRNYYGDPFTGCFLRTSSASIEPDSKIDDPCEPFPCGEDAKCTQNRGHPICSCPIDYEGDPSEKCTPKIPKDPNTFTIIINHHHHNYDLEANSGLPQDGEMPTQGGKKPFPSIKN